MTLMEAIGSSPRTWGIRHLQSHRQSLRRFIPTNVGNTRAVCSNVVAIAVHPHERGEYSFGPPDNKPDPRFIPTNVGNTRIPARSGLPSPVHPHERGEYTPHRKSRLPLTGSSPRTWGILPEEGQEVERSRFIPTNVGNTPQTYLPESPSQVHPHERGEYSSKVPRDLLDTGSSPRTWGIRPFRPEARQRKRFIPTNVGNTLSPDSAAIRRSVHPHERGEYACKSHSIDYY